MALASQLSHKLITNTAMPYQTFTSPIDQNPQFVGGRNVMINAKQYCTMRPGFADYLELNPTTFNHVLRIYSWARWDGTYFVMVVDHLADGRMALYKLQVGSDSSFQQIHVESTVSGVAYSFVLANNYLFFSNPSDCYKWSPDHGLQNWGIRAPAAAPTFSLSSGVLSPVIGGYQYVITYENSVTGHESSPSPASVSTGTFSSQNVIVSWQPGADPQVDTVNIYRTVDSLAANPPNSQQMALVASVPLHSSPYTDSMSDAYLSAVQFAPAWYQNDPPMPLKAIVMYVGRVWGILDAEVWYSGQEEITNGVPQECFPGASIHSPAGNFYAYETRLTALAPLSDGVAIFNANRIQKIEGDTQDTFRRLTLLAKRGAVIDYTVKVVGNSVLWLDRSKQLWLSDQGEIGRDIRPDLTHISLLTAQASIHIAGEQHWILLLDPDNELLYVYDLDLNGWNVPWSVNATAIESIDLSPGQTRLAAAMNGTQVMMENPGLYLDADKQYDAFCVTNSFSLAPENNPDFIAQLHHVAIESNQYQPVLVSVKVEEDPSMLSAMSLITVGGGRQATVLSVNGVGAHRPFPDALIVQLNTNPFFPGDIVYFSGLTHNSWLNGCTLTVRFSTGNTIDGVNGSWAIALNMPTIPFGPTVESSGIASTGQTTQVPIIRPLYNFNPLLDVTDPPRRGNGTYLIQKNYMAMTSDAAPACRRCALRLDWKQPEPALWALYSIDLAMTPVGQ